jgi:hypothetical protein
MLSIHTAIARISPSLLPGMISMPYVSRTRIHFLLTCHQLFAGLDLVLVVEDVPGDVELVAVGQFHDHSVTDRGDELLLDPRGFGALRRLHHHRVLDVEFAFLDLVQRAAVAGLDNERPADSQGFAVDLEDPIPVVVEDPTVISNRPEFLSFSW